MEEGSGMGEGFQVTRSLVLRVVDGSFEAKATLFIVNLAADATCVRVDRNTARVLPGVVGRCSRLYLRSFQELTDKRYHKRGEIVKRMKGKL